MDAPPAPGDRFLKRGWTSAKAADAAPEAATAPKEAHSAARPTSLALQRPEVALTQELPKDVVDKPLIPQGSPQLSRACGYDPRRQQVPQLDAEQLANARTIVAVGRMLDLPPRAAVIAIATAYQESWLRNLNWGDRDSLGLFQQRPSYGWGTPKQLQTPVYAAAAFYGPLMKVRGWNRLPVTVAAQTVQRSGFPDRYAQWELMAATIVDRLLEVPDQELSCSR